MLEFPINLEKIIFTHLKKFYLKPHMKNKGDRFKYSKFLVKDYEYFSKGVKRLTQSYTLDRSNLAQNYFNDPVLRSGYILYFLPVNLMKVVRVLEKLILSNWIKKEMNILDIGCGPGTSALAMMYYISEQIKENKIDEINLNFHLVDQNDGILKDAKVLIENYTKNLRLDSSKFKVKVFTYSSRDKRYYKFLKKKVDLLILANMMNELKSRAQQKSFMMDMSSHFLNEKKGDILILEPALKRQSRDLQFIRDEVLSSEKFQVLLPCVHQSDCPLNLANKRDWCHFYFAWKCPDFIRKVDKVIGNKKDWLAASYIYLSNSNFKVKSRSHIWRVISNKIHQKGKTEILLCGEKGRYRMTRLSRNESKDNRGFDQVRRGDLVEYQLQSDSKNFNLDGAEVIDHKTQFKVIS